MNLPEGVWAACTQSKEDRSGPSGPGRVRDLEVGTDSLRAQLDKAVPGQMPVRASLEVGLQIYWML